jgi:hypothetical protein
MHRIAPLSFLALGFTLGCTSAHVARPDEMSRSGHAHEAQRQERAGNVEAAQYDPEATVEVTQCETINRPERHGITSVVPCWTSVSNPTDVHRQRAAEHRQEAADHRAASQVLRDAEREACAGIPEMDRDMSPFEHSEDISRVEPFTEINTASIPLRRTTGAVVTFRALPGMTAEWLQRVVDCHLARNASLGHVVPEMPNCPLVPREVEAHVASTGDGFAVTIRSDNEESARDVLARSLRAQAN